MDKITADRAQAKWGKFSSQQLQKMKGDLDGLIKLIQVTYGYSKSRAEMEFHDFQLSLRSSLHPSLKPIR